MTKAEILKYFDDINFAYNDCSRYDSLSHMLDELCEDQEIGHWTREIIRNEYGGCIRAKMICSECGEDNGYDKIMKFCPNCGKKMEVLYGE